ncbi:hypothetical protein [Brevibacillus sp. HB2.2]|uniref:hypothetical protein n=1 Tax=Brevibacillus sp. HB2.2 TaxID=2738846 RepID=UPI00156BB265|nr:hypothetical protein [Brevibacillus sp. HB2.2]NRS51981.1 hypothetical protein [Brevibacillus sp. HB2.2]
MGQIKTYTHDEHGNRKTANNLPDVDLNKGTYTYDLKNSLHPYRDKEKDTLVTYK